MVAKHIQRQRQFLSSRVLAAKHAPHECAMILSRVKLTWHRFRQIQSTPGEPHFCRIRTTEMLRRIEGTKLAPLYTAAKPLVYKYYLPRRESSCMS